MTHDCMKEPLVVPKTLNLRCGNQTNSQVRDLLSWVLFREAAIGITIACNLLCIPFPLPQVLRSSFLATYNNHKYIYTHTNIHTSISLFYRSETPYTLMNTQSNFARLCPALPRIPSSKAACVSWTSMRLSVWGSGCV